MSQVLQGRNLLVFGLIILLTIIGFYALNRPDQRTAGAKIGDAFDQLGDRTPGEEIGNTIKDASNPQ